MPVFVRHCGLRQQTTGAFVELDLTLPYATQELPGIGGHLRAAPDSFIVEEIPLYQPSGAGQHLYVNIPRRR